MPPDITASAGDGVLKSPQQTCSNNLLFEFLFPCTYNVKKQTILQVAGEHRMKKTLNELIITGFTGILVFGSIFAAQMAEVTWTNRDIWWTNEAKPLSFEQGTKKILLSLSRKTLRQHLDDGTLFAVAADGKQYRVAPKDITVRLNTWCEVESRMLASALFSAFLTGASCACFLIGLIQLRQSRKAVI